MFGAQQYAKMAARVKDTSTQLSDSADERTAHVAANHPVVSFEHTVYVGFSAGIP